MDEQHDSTPQACPPELLTIYLQLRELRPPARSAALSAMSAVVTAMMVSPAQVDLPPLTSEQKAVIEYLQEHGVTSAANLAHHTGYSERTIKRWCEPGAVLGRHGVIATSRGYGLASN